MKLFLCALGLVFVIEGMPYLAFPGPVKTILLKIGNISERNLRIIGMMAVSAGLILIAIGWS